MSKNFLAMSFAMEAAVASQSVQTILYLVEQGEPLDARQRSTGATLLLCVIQDNLIDLAYLLIDKGANINAKSMDGETPLLCAARAGHTELVRLLLGRGANPNTRSNSSFTPMMWADVNGHHEIVELLRQAGGRFS